MRNHLINVARRQEAELAEKPDFLDKTADDNDNLPRPGKPMVIGFDGGYVRDCHNRKNNFEIITGKAYAQNIQAKRFGYVHMFENNPRKRLLSVLHAQGMQTNLSKSSLYIPRAKISERDTFHVLLPNNRFKLAVTQFIHMVQYSAKMLPD
ncbi:hypothetical protein Xszus_00748 [Xenorhabdus szentirmaii]|nr:hypothetical protein Xsze_03368 [Xenorhabdus szentirmaii DSM 16338]PHM41071.1 hypothetical protein Xszus_00748 [Xenorhabdus szentirmaii]